MSIAVDVGSAMLTLTGALKNDSPSGAGPSHLTCNCLLCEHVQGYKILQGRFDALSDVNADGPVFLHI